MPKVIVANWLDVVSQFGIDAPIDKRYKTSREILNELKEQNKSFDPREPGIAIEVEHDNIDSAVALFNFDKTDEEGFNVFIYTGTAK